MSNPTSSQTPPFSRTSIDIAAALACAYWHDRIGLARMLAFWDAQRKAMRKEGRHAAH